MKTIILASILLTAQNPTLGELKTSYDELQKLPWAQRLEKFGAHNDKVIKLIESDALKTGDEWFAVSNVLEAPMPDFELNRIRYELAYAAAVTGHQEARAALATRWDELTMSLGRNRTLESVKLPAGSNPPGTWIPNYSPKSIRDILLNPNTPRNPEKDSTEIAKMFEEDQAVREGSMDQKKIEEMVKGDQKRMARIKDLLKQGKVKTGEDFYKAAFLYQHGNTFAEYHTAHELSISAMILGHKGAKWIGAASYDRMLHSCGHRQRWATQYGIVGGQIMLQRYDTSGTSDLARKLVVGLSLEEAKNRKFNP